jgi:decaprenylphospho-beta-D-erythro-pentofuranosid-2-ulose 2-reductase
MSNILIIGATSAIAEHCARLWAARGDTLFLVGRNQERLSVIASDLRVRGAAQVYEQYADLNAIDQQAELIESAYSTLKKIDAVLIAHGTLSDQDACQQSVKLTLDEIQNNALSTVALLTILANHFEQQGLGSIAVISSVAGDRGRASNYVYGSAKAMVTTFTSGLRQRLTSRGVNVVTIKPGFVDTPMTASFKKGLLWAQPNTVAKQIVKAIDQKKSVVYTPGFWRWIMLIIQHIPNVVFKRIKL